MYSKEKIKKILLYRTDRLGDMILTLPVLKVIRNYFNDSKITVFCDEKFLTIKDISDNADLLIGFDANRIRSINGLFQKISEINNQSFDLAVDLMPAACYLSSVIMMFVKAKYKSGLAVGLRKYFINIKSYPDENIYFETDRVFHIVKQIGINRSSDKLLISSYNKDDEKIGNMLKSKFISEKDLLIGIHPGVGKLNPKKSWDLKKYSELGLMLMEKYKANIVLTGSKIEKESMSEINEYSGNKFIILNSELNAGQLISLIKKMKLFISANTGPMHIAVLSGVPAVIINGYSNMKRWGSQEGNYTVVQKDYECIPCEGKYRECITRDHRCMKDISADDVFNACEKHLKKV
jgi:ADP-heptose:LPS heptosyltransferase